MLLAEHAGLAEGAALNSMRREEVLSRLFQVASAQQWLVASGILEVMEEGYGFLRQVSPHVTTGDVYISQSRYAGSDCERATRYPGKCAPPKRESGIWVGSRRENQ